MGKIGKIVKALTEDNRPECGVKKEGSRGGYCTRKRDKNAKTCGRIECETTYWNGKSGFDAYR